MISSRMFTSCTSPLVTRMKVGMLPCRSSKVCILTAALRRRNFAHGNSDRHRSMVVEFQSIQTLIQIDANRVERMQRPGNADQYLSELRKDSPIMRFVSIGQRRARHFAAEPHVIQLAL